jgi:hypothetical protein
MNKVGICYAYRTHNWDADAVPFVAKVLWASPPAALRCRGGRLAEKVALSRPVCSPATRGRRGKVITRIAVAPGGVD